jgi:hypothetical protein
VTERAARDCTTARFAAKLTAMSDESEIVVHEAVGPAIGAVSAAAAIYLGSLAMLMVGVMPAILGALADEGRLSAAGIGQCATLECLTIGICAGLCGAFLKPGHLRWVAGVSAVALALLDLVSMPLGGVAVMLARALAGIPEGILLWITVGMIARSLTPERIAGFFWTSIVSGQLFLAMTLVYLIPHFGSAGGFAALGIIAFSGLAAAFYTPPAYAPLVDDMASGAPPLRGWIALLATLIYTAAGGAVTVYLQPMAHEAGLTADVARSALWISLAAQVCGGLSATLLAGRVHYYTVFVGSSVVYIASWYLFTLHPPAWLFLLANAMFGFVIVLIGPFLVPMTIEADPSRRTAMQSGATQLLAGALGPLLASFVVDDRNVFGVIVLGSGLILGGLALMTVLHVAALRARRAARGDADELGGTFMTRLEQTLALSVARANDSATSVSRRQTWQRKRARRPKRP